MVSNDDFDGKATHLNCFYMHINFEQKYPIVIGEKNEETWVQFGLSPRIK